MSHRNSVLIVKNKQKQSLLNQNQKYNILIQQPQEHWVANDSKLCFLILLTFGLLVSMWVLCQAIYYQNNDSLSQSYQDASGLLFGLFIFYLLAFGIGWYWGSGQRQQLKLRVVEKQIAKKRAMQALQNME